MSNIDNGSIEKMSKKSSLSWIKRLGWTAVALFTLKGLAWLFFGATLFEIFKACD